MDRSEAGIAVLEVLVASVVVGIAAIGIALMFSLGNAWVAAGGDNRVAMRLAQQKIEQLRSLGFTGILVGGPGAAGTFYNEGGTWWFTTAAGTCNGTSYACAPQPRPTTRNFTRLTCVQYVSDTNVGSPAYTGGTTGSPCPAGAATSTLRIVVIVQPSRSIEKDPPVILQAWITAIPGGI